MPSARAAAKSAAAAQREGEKALRYPAIVLTLAVLVVLAMVILVLPEFAAIYKTFNTPLPMLTQMVMGMAAFIQSYALALFVALLTPLAAARALRHNPRWQRMLMHIPVMGALAKGQKLGHIFTVLSLTQQAGIPFYRVWRAQRRPLKVVTGGDTHSVREDIEKGLPVWSSFQKAAIFTPLCIQLYEPVKCQVRWTSCWQISPGTTRNRPFNGQIIWRHFEPVLLIVTGVIIGTLVVAMYLPIFHLGMR